MANRDDDDDDGGEGMVTVAEILEQEEKQTLSFPVAKYKNV